MDKRAVARGAVGRLREPCPVGRTAARGAAGDSRGVVAAPVPGSAATGRSADAADRLVAKARPGGPAVILWGVRTRRRKVARALLAVVVLLLYAAVAGAGAPSGGEAAVRAKWGCDARVSSLSRVTESAAEIRAGLMLRLAVEHVSCSELPGFKQAARIANEVVEMLRVDEGRCMAADGYAAAAQAAADGADDLARGVEIVRASCVAVSTSGREGGDRAP